MFLFIFLLGVLWSIAAWTAEPARLMIVHSYGPDNPTAIPQEKGALEALRTAGWQEGKNLTVRRFFMDTKRRYVTPEQIRQRGLAARQAIVAFHPDILLTIDDNAFQQVATQYVDADFSVVFSGLNYPVTYYRTHFHLFTDIPTPQHNLTGVFEHLPLERSLDILGLIRHMTATDRAVIITDTSPTGDGIRLSAEAVLRHYRPGFRVDLEVVDTVDQYRRLLEALNADPHVKGLYLGVLRLRRPGGPAWNARDIVRWTVAHNRIPELTLSYTLVRAGCFGGVALDMRAMGRQAGQKVAALLAGRPLRSLPLEAAHEYGIVFNYRRAQALGIDLPPTLLWAADEVFAEP